MNGRIRKGSRNIPESYRKIPDDVDSYYALGWVYGKLRDYEGAKKAFQETIRLEPDYVYAHYGLGIAYLVLGDRGMALEEYKILKSLEQYIADLLFDQIYP